MTLSEIREEIDKIDTSIVPFFLERMEKSRLVAEYKKQNEMPVFDENREAEIIRELTYDLPQEKAVLVEKLYNRIFEISKEAQREILCERKINYEYGLCGKTLVHSYSKRIHNLLGNDKYELINLEKDEFYSFVKSRSFKSVNVTIPYKKDAFSLCDVVDDSAKSVGSVNTLVNKDGVIHGYNTDIDGFIYMIDRAKIDFCGKNVVILGTGGTSLTAREVCRIKKAKKVTVVSREGKINYDNISCLYDTEILINTTPVGMYPNTESVPVDIGLFPNLSGVVDVIYNPYETKLVQSAKKRNIPSTSGLPMLVMQAVRAHEHFFDTKCEENIAESILSKTLFDTLNIVLVGMPSSGKTTVGKILAQRLGRKLVDTDEEISKNGLSIQEIFETYGQEYFRNVEEYEIGKISKKSSLVIATGGGAVLRQKNRDDLRQNSFVVYIKRDIDKLSDKGRPLSKGGPERIKQLYCERHEIYENVCDFFVENNGDVNECVNKILKVLDGIDYYSLRGIKTEGGEKQ